MCIGVNPPTSRASSSIHKRIHGVAIGFCTVEKNYWLLKLSIICNVWAGCFKSAKNLSPGGSPYKIFSGIQIKFAKDIFLCNAVHGWAEARACSSIAWALYARNIIWNPVFKKVQAIRHSARKLRLELKSRLRASCGGCKETFIPKPCWIGKVSRYNPRVVAEPPRPRYGPSYARKYAVCRIGV